MDVFAPVALLQNKKTPPVATSTALTSHATSTPITPARLKIAAIGVDAAVVQVGKKDDGSMGTPQVFGEVGWYALGSKPGEPGNAVLDGHVNNALTTAGVFQHLNQVKLGDIITLSDTSGATLTYKVTQLQQYPADTAPDASIFAVSGPSQVVLITCDGDWVESAKSYSKRFVVFATLQ
jgi:LPXTG-site transpeptidase (sortase) family protein